MIVQQLQPLSYKGHSDYYIICNEAYIWQGIKVQEVLSFYRKHFLNVYSRMDHYKAYHNFKLNEVVQSKTQTEIGSRIECEIFLITITFLDLLTLSSVEGVGGFVPVVWTISAVLECTDRDDEGLILVAETLRGHCLSSSLTESSDLLMGLLLWDSFPFFLCLVDLVK